uniref:SAP domain-containing protein n=1 Tax=Erpetoichthys calabaricus TaxID=27687 RepID=A0A8C4T809_ERPCA
MTSSDIRWRRDCLSLTIHIRPQQMVSVPFYLSTSHFSGRQTASQTGLFLSFLPSPPSDHGELRQKKARLAEDLSEKILKRPGPLELVQKNILPLGSTELSELLLFVCENWKKLVLGRGLSYLLFIGIASICICFVEFSQHSSLLNQVKPPRPKKPKESKPKVRRLKYHQYVPPDQKTTTLVMDPAYSRLLQQQQVFLQLQILQQQQQGSTTQQLCVQGIGSSSTVSPPSVKVKPKCSASPPGSTHKPELLPSNLDDLTVSELRQQLRKRGLPVSGTKPALLERLKPYQIQWPCAPPAPLRGAPILVPSATLTSPIDSTQSGVSTFITPADGSTPVNTVTSSSSREEVRIAQERKLPECNVPSWDIPVDWRRAEDMRVEMEMQQRLKNRHRERGASLGPSQHRLPATATGATQHIQLEFQPGDGEKSPQDSPVLPVFCSQPCEPIGQDFELPMEITASPPQPLPAARTLEEELQEAIQRVQMAPSQSIDDILDEPLSCSDAQMSQLLSSPCYSSFPSNLSPFVPTDSSLAEHEASQLITVPLLAHSPPPPPSQPALHEDANFLTEPLCPSLSLELPDSPPPPMVSPPSASSVMDILSSHKGCQEAMTFDPADWLEALTFGLRPNSPPVPPFVSTDFGLDSDISTMRVLDLIIEQW